MSSLCVISLVSLLLSTPTRVTAPPRRSSGQPAYIHLSSLYLSLEKGDVIELEKPWIDAELAGWCNGKSLRTGLVDFPSGSVVVLATRLTSHLAVVERFGPDFV